MTILKILSTFCTFLVLSTPVQSQDCNDAFTAYIVLDGSRSIGSANFDLVKNSVKDFTARAILRNSTNRIGIVVFSADVTNNITASSNISALMNEIVNIRYPQSGTATDLGISFARGELRKDESFNRRVMIVITDGDSNDPDKTFEAAKKAKDDGITIIAVGIDQVIKMFGSQYDMYEKELLNIASYNSLVYRTDFFKDLSKPLNEVLQRLCQHVVSIVRALEDMTVVSGTNVTFRITLTDTDVTNGVWKRFGKELHRTAGYTKRVDGRMHTLMRFNTGIEHSGEYSFTVDNATSRCTLTVIGRLRDFSVKAGQNAYFQIFVSPAPIAGGKWFKNGQRLFFSSSKYVITQQASIRSLSVLNVQDSDEGRYSFTLNNVSTSANLRLQGPPVDGGWTAWVTTSTICPDCGLDAMGNVTRIRTCTNPAPANGGRNCEGPPSRILMKNCNLRVDCTVNGSWSEWTAWSSNCDNGTCGQNYVVDAVRTRACNNPSPSGTGLFCRGESYQAMKTMCQRVPCRGNGGFGEWSTWTTPTCPVSCGGGKRTLSRKRRCDSLKPSNGGANCTGAFEESKSDDCQTIPCPKNGGFGEWSTWSIPACPVSCGGGNRTLSRHRQCNSPKPSNGGANCTGDLEESKSEGCNTFPCPKNGGFGEWSNWTDPKCPVSCGGGNRTLSRQRRCNSPKPSNGGANCTGHFKELRTEDCNTFPCPENGGFGEWSNWTTPACSVSCGGGNRTLSRQRRCDSPIPSKGGANCTGAFEESKAEDCNKLPCPEDGRFRDWSTWTTSTCSVTCGGGKKILSRERRCDSPKPSNGGANCKGAFESKSEDCNTFPCPEKGGFGEWSSWNYSSCPVSCGGGKRTLSRQRRCDSPAPPNGGTNCTGDFLESKLEDCNQGLCPVNGGFGEWSTWTTPACPVSCGGGKRTLSRQRRCVSPKPSKGGANCTGAFEESKSEDCNTFPCPKNGGFGEWSTWSYPACSVSCGGGERTLSRQRRCDSPTPRNGGTNCTGDFGQFKSGSCNIFPCPENGGFGAWSTWTISTCSVTCGGGIRTLSRQRKCDSPEPSNGGAKCTGDYEELKSEECNTSPCDGLCNDVIEKDDIGYRYHQSDCDRYIQCYSNVDGNVQAVVRTCPAGFYWNQAKFKCQESRRVLCPLESYSSSRMSMKKIPGSCRSYWLKEERAQARCCPLSFSFVEGKGCRPNKDCQDQCPPPFEYQHVCDKRPLSLTRSPSYQLYNSLRGWVDTTCPTGTVFNLVDCGCSELARDTCVSAFSVMFNASTIPDWVSGTGVTFRDGSAKFFGFGIMTFDINFGAKFNPIKIEFRYNEFEETFGSRILLRSNCYDNDNDNNNDLSVHVDDNEMNVRVKTGNKDVQQFALSTRGIKRSAWKTVKLLYDGRRFVITIESGNLRYSGDLYVYGSDFTQCQMVFGSETAFSPTNAFRGSVSMISFSKCNWGLAS